MSALAEASAQGWFKPLNESNAIFMPRSLWEELGGYDEAFETPGGGFVNSDTLTRAVSLTNTTIITLLGEGTFHQVHGGVATNSLVNMKEVFHSEYARLRGQRFRTPRYESVYFGSLPSHVMEWIERSVFLTR